MKVDKWVSQRFIGGFFFFQFMVLAFMIFACHHQVKKKKTSRLLTIFPLSNNYSISSTNF